jgi:peptidoglycan/LPS O-acetylase OafA/YrhL
VLTLLLAAASWTLIERPAQRRAKLWRPPAHVVATA